MAGRLHTQVNLVDSNVLEPKAIALVCRSVILVSRIITRLILQQNLRFVPILPSVVDHVVAKSD